MFAYTTSGLAGLPGHGRTRRGWLYLTDDYRVIEYPTIWAAEVAQRKSKSPETLEQYGSTLARWLRFLDEHKYRAEKWQKIDRDVIHHYIDVLVAGRDEQGRPSDETIEGYLAKLTDFYRSAAKAGYRHFWDMDNEEVKRIIKDKTTTTLDVVHGGLKREIKLQRGESTLVQKEMNEFVHQQDLTKAMGLFDDYVYAVIAYVIRNTALRPKELFQLPYKGKGVNIGLRNHRIVAVEKTDDNGNAEVVEILVTDDADRTEITGNITFRFESKGKIRSIPFPLHLWTFICKHWMPERNRRVQLYSKNFGNGQCPSDDCLFITKEGRPVNYDMLYTHFRKISEHPDYVKKPFTPKMLRHSWATYYVYEALKAAGSLDSDYTYNAVHDAYLREYMGHTDIATTYKHYVHVVQVYARKDVMGKLIEKADKELNAKMIALAT